MSTEQRTNPLSLLLEGSGVAYITSTGMAFRDLLSDSQSTEVETAYGPVPVQIGSLSTGVTVASLLRSREGVPRPPHEVPHRAHMHALRALGVKQVIATSVVGGLREWMIPGDLILLDQFLDFTRQRNPTAFDGSSFQFTDFTHPYCPSLRQAMLEAANELDQPIIPRGCYVGVDGPRYETAAEIRMYSLLGGDVIGMTNVPEAVFARELGLCYASVAIVSNLGAGLTAQPVRIEDISQTVNRATDIVLQLLTTVAPKLNQSAACDCIPVTRTFHGV